MWQGSSRRFLLLILALHLGCSATLIGEVSEQLSDGVPVSAARIFVTSTRYGPGFGSLALMDQVCATHAQAAGLTRRYIALASSQAEGVTAYSRVPAETRIYQLTDAASPVKLADHRDQFFGVSPGPAWDENRAIVTGGLAGVWTGTDTGGTSSGVDCDGWTSSTNPDQGTAGTVGSNAPLWLNSSPILCGTFTLHLYCIGI